MEHIQNMNLHNIAIPLLSPQDSSKKKQVRGRNGEPHKPKIFQCTFGDCRMVFTRAEHLARHERKHTGEKPFQCIIPNCSRIFSRFDNMMQHVQTHSSRTGKPPLSGLMSNLSSGSRRKNSGKPPHSCNESSKLPNAPNFLQSMGIPLSPSQPILPPYEPTLDSIFYPKLSPITELKSIDMFGLSSTGSNILKRRFSQPVAVAYQHGIPQKRRLSLDPTLLFNEQTAGPFHMSNTELITASAQSYHSLTPVSEEGPSTSNTPKISPNESVHRGGTSRRLSVVDICNSS
ncbi:Up in starvation [Basidiobolus ranarum]|uniref:Up in starvation n=1 Tax=Basidiobolus ranarum TaxID=34480 RepID=A0ABR2WLN9_9FUNG